jgi:hypothetical protein
VRKSNLEAIDRDEMELTYQPTVFGNALMGHIGTLVMDKTPDNVRQELERRNKVRYETD